MMFLPWFKNIQQVCEQGLGMARSYDGYEAIDFMNFMGIVHQHKFWFDWETKVGTILTG
jgi:hypothetical protein